MDKSQVEITLHEAVMPVRLGWSDEERSRKQLVTVNLKFRVQTSGVERSDELEDTLDYCKVLKLLETECAEKTWRLIEKMTADLADALLSQFAQVGSLEISVRKNVFANTKGVSVTRFVERA